MFPKSHSLRVLHLSTKMSETTHLHVLPSLAGIGYVRFCQIYLLLVNPEVDHTLFDYTL